MPRSLISLFERKLNCPVSTLGSKWASMAENEKDEIKEWLEEKYEIFAVLGPLEREVKFGDITLEGSNATFVHSGGFDTVQCHYYRQGYILSRPELPCMTENGGMKALRHPHLNFFPLEILEARSRKKNLKNDTNLKDNSKKLPPGMNRKLGGKDSKKISSGNKNEKFTEPESLAQLAKNKKVEAVGSESDLRCSVSKARPNKKRSRSLSPSNSSPRKKRTKTDKVSCLSCGEFVTFSVASYRKCTKVSPLIKLCSYKICSRYKIGF